MGISLVKITKILNRIQKIISSFKLATRKRGHWNKISHKEPQYKNMRIKDKAI